MGKAKAASIKVTRSPAKDEPFPVVGIGASAGGLEAIEKFFSNLPDVTGMAYVIIQHLHPGYKSIMADILRKHTVMKVREVEDGMRIVRDQVYLNPPDKEVALFNGIFHLSDPIETHGLRLPIDYFFRSLARERGEKAACAILSGTGSDGTLGLEEVKGAGGMTLVQEEKQASYGGMPGSAIRTGLVDFILPVEKMPEEIARFMKHPHFGRRKNAALEKHLQGFIQKILMLVRISTGHDFNLYKQNTIRRRIERRMIIHKIAQISDYYRYLRENKEEIKILFQDLLIGVTRFFRDPEAFDALKKEAIIPIVERKPEGSTVRVWVPGCASGEEALSVAMLFTEVMEEHEKNLSLQIFATDIDSSAIERARLAEYPESIVSDVPVKRLQRFFVKSDDVYRIKKEIRETMIFAIQNLISDPPFSKLDLISCRNLLIYMDLPLQKKIIPLFHYVLNDEGYLFLGTSETIGQFSDLFKPVDIRHKVFSRKETFTGGIAGYPLLSFPETATIARSGLEAVAEKGMDAHQLMDRIILREYVPPSLLINEKCEILYFQGATDRYLTTPAGEPSFNVLKIARDSIRHKLSAAVRRAIKENKMVISAGVTMKRGDEHSTVDIAVRPLSEEGAAQNLYLIVFDERKIPEDIARKREKSSAGEVDPRITSLEQDLQVTQEYLRTTVEELETSNEELKSTNEELQSANEELQSTNEELETAKEELQSTNEELITVNSELQLKLDDLTRAGNDINNLLASTDIGTLFLDCSLVIKRFTPLMTEIFNLKAADIGRSIRDITSRIDYGSLFEDAERVLSTLQVTEREVRSGRGKCFSMRILPYRTRENIIDGVVMTFVDTTERKLAEEEAESARLLAEDARLLAEGIVDTVREPLLVLDEELKVISANHSFYRSFNTTQEETLQRRIYDIGSGQWNIAPLRKLLEQIIPENSTFENFVVKHEFPMIGHKVMNLNARQINFDKGRRAKILLAIRDVTEDSRK